MTTTLDLPIVLRRVRHGEHGRLLLLHGLANSATVWQNFTDHDTGCATWAADLPWRGEGVAGWSHRGDLTDWIAQAVNALATPAPDPVADHFASPTPHLIDTAPGQSPPAPGASPHENNAIEHAFGVANEYSTGVKRTGQGDLVVVAHSFSANLLLSLLDRTPELGVGGIVLVSPFYRAEPEGFEWADIARYLNDFHLIMEDGIRAQGGQRLSPGVRRELALRVRDLVGPYGWTRFFQTYLATPWLRLDRVTTPVLVLSGENDFAALPAEARALAAALPNARARVLPDCGHFLMAERPERFAAEITRFVHSLPVGETTR
ncbi:alpha/beta fold hydrolase [Actinokineospora fastidiosa]|uniref:AB hydrolase-1 domain-containing protein n=1 Tax=Actinokineospora fastidiosa TaxID=1816 RepID=A0A918LEI4_9PSEU|nr:alpha/beta hydrolase [Actinokineospora fastidiosa]GGS36243.1 hypothetical protein GCM10010171_33600 [Actinokineospora fastidiosa]